MFPSDCSSRYCDHCRDCVYCVKVYDHWGGLHLIMVVLTCGLWLPVFLLHFLVRGPMYACTYCGKRV